MDTISPTPSNPPSRSSAFFASTRRALIAYARWLDSITWKRFILLSILAMIAAGVLTNLPPFNIEWGSGSPVRRTVRISSTDATPKPPIVVHGVAREGYPRGKSYNITIDKNGVHITPADRAKTAAAVPAAPAVPSVPAWPASAASMPASPMPPAAPASGTVRAGADDDEASVDVSKNGIHIKLPEGADTEEVRQAIEEAQSDIEDAIRDSGDHSVHVPALAWRRSFKLGDVLPQFTFLLIVLSMVTKIMAAGRFKAEAKAVVATEMAESEALKRQVVEARMAAMQAQVEPHFLFNTLASIDHLIETDPARASQMQKNLIALLRASMPTMREAHPSAHNLGREMAVIKPYLEILKVRMEDRLQTEVDVPEGLLSAEFPSMMIQSLVENAIKHGLEPKAEGGKLTVRAEIVHGKLAVTVSDTGLGFGRAATAGTGVGLANIRERLQLLYGNRASMTITENTPTGTAVVLVVPYQAQPRDGESP